MKEHRGFCAMLALLAVPVVLATAGAAQGAGLSGNVVDGQGKPATGVFLMLMTPQWQPKTFTNSGSDGTFKLDGAAKGDLIICQPPTIKNAEGLELFSLQPRIYQMGDKSAATFKLPAAGCLILRGYDASGQLMRFEDYEKRGKFAGQFCGVTGMGGELKPPCCWWVHDKESGGFGAKREKGLPAFMVEPKERFIIQMLYWEVPGYGKLLLRADNGGQGFAVNAPGEHAIIQVAVELARTAVDDLVKRADAYPADAKTKIEEVKTKLADAMKLTDEPQRNQASNGVLSAALKLRDDLELAAAEAAIPSVRKGKLQIQVADAKGAPAAKCKVHIRQTSRDFSFGVLEGSPYNAKAYEQARQEGFDLATVLLGWNWTKPDGDDWSGVDRTFGVSALKKLGYAVKGHGVIFLQGYGIMPDAAKTMKASDLPKAILDHEQVLMEGAIGKQIDIWEVINEPGYTNVVNLPRKDVVELAKASARLAKERTGKPTLINSGHDINFGSKYLMYDTDGNPWDNYSTTYHEFLLELQQADGLKDIDIVGLQIYPGSHLSALFGGIETPAFTPSWVLDTVERYAKDFGKPIHITEFSLPSYYGPTWKCGYWKDKWSPQVQADYADMVYTFAFAHPSVQSVTWWGISALKPDVETGCLYDRMYKAKPVLERIRQRMAAWTTELDAETDASGAALLEGFGGEYEITVTMPDGKTTTATAHIKERDTATVTIKPGSDK
ncbi:MAG TPA: hypothetical protein PK967_03990 [Candidatus Hydrogenedentes bacterium]|nr:hypothetical protein [Candidatus Hydrogenedentota bacterium]